MLAGLGVALADDAADASAAYRRGDYATALALYRTLAEQGDTAAQNILGNMYDQGEGASRNTVEANKWWYRAALHGDTDALRHFANMSCQKLYPNGKGAIPGVNCLNTGGANYDLLVKSNDIAVPPSPAAVVAPKATPAAVAPLASRVEVPVGREHGTFTVPVEVNGEMTLDFIVDSGAAFVTLPADIFARLQQDGSVRDSDLRGRGKMTLADGSTREGAIFIIRSLRLGGMLFENIKGAVVPEGGKLLLGETFFARVKSWSIDNDKGKLILDMASANDMPTYREQIVSILSRNKNYPANSASRGEQGTAIVSFTIDRNGRLLERHLNQSAGSPALDREALGLLDRSQPFPPLPPDYTEVQLTMVVPLTFAIPASGAAAK